MRVCLQKELLNSLITETVRKVWVVSRLKVNFENNRNIFHINPYTSTYWIHLSKIKAEKGVGTVF